MQKQKENQEKRRARSSFYRFIADRACHLLTCDLTDDAFYALYCNFMTERKQVPYSKELIYPHIYCYIRGLRLIYQHTFPQMIVDSLIIE